MASNTIHIMIVIDAVPSNGHDIQNYNLALGICAGAISIILSLAILVLAACAFLKWRLHQSKESVKVYILAYV